MLSWSSAKDDSIATSKDETSVKPESSYVASTSRRVYRARRTITAASGTDDLDLMALTDPHGDSVSFALIHEVHIQNLNTTSGDDLYVGGAGVANNAWNALFNTDDDAQQTFGPGGIMSVGNKTDGWAVDASNKVLRIENGTTGSTITYDIVVIGTI